MKKKHLLILTCLAMVAYWLYLVSGLIKFSWVVDFLHLLNWVFGGVFSVIAPLLVFLVIVVYLLFFYKDKE